MNNDVIARLAAANPVPTGEPLHLPEAIQCAPAASRSRSCSPR